MREKKGKFGFNKYKKKYVVIMVVGHGNTGDFAPDK